MKEAVKKRALRRLKILEGQVRGLQRMVERDTYCIDVIHQSLAIKQALSGVENVLLENHLAICVVEQMKNGKEQKSIKEILDIYQLSKKK